MLTGEQVQSARIMVRLKQPELAERAGVSVGTVKRLEQTQGAISANVNTVLAVKTALEDAGAVFIAAGDGMGPGVRLRGAEIERAVQQPAAQAPETLREALTAYFAEEPARLGEWTFPEDVTPKAAADAVASDAREYRGALEALEDEEAETAKRAAAILRAVLG